MQTLERRHDIDWIRVIAILLLVIYHVAIGFQPWGMMIGFITNEKSWASLWMPMTMLNVWRIPLLFFVSGMGVYLAMRNRNWKQLLVERSLRIGVPYLFGYFAIVPIHVCLLQYYYDLEITYFPDPGHLWFLGNIFSYVLILLPVLYLLKTHEEGKVVGWLKRMMKTPLGILPFLLLFIVEAVLVDPNPFELYAKTWHGFFIGLLAFGSGFCFMISGSAFWKMLQTWRFLFLVLAIALYALRIQAFPTIVEPFRIGMESNFWILSVFAFGSKYLNRGGNSLRYLSQAAYPVYIFHMIFLYLGSMVIFPLSIDVSLQFVLLLLFTLAGCLVSFELVRRVPYVRALFGLKAR